MGRSAKYSEEMMEKEGKTDAAEHAACLALMPLPMSVHNCFWDSARLLFMKPQNPAYNLEWEVIPFLEAVVRFWFREWQEGAADGWQQWLRFCQRKIHIFGD